VSGDIEHIDENIASTLGSPSAAYSKKVGANGCGIHYLRFELWTRGAVSLSRWFPVGTYSTLWSVTRLADAS
jgi:hypothetical protein